MTYEQTRKLNGNDGGMSPSQGLTQRPPWGMLNETLRSAYLIVPGYLKETFLYSH